MCFFLHRNSRWPPKMTEKPFWGKKLPGDISNTLGVNNFVEIALSHTVSKINVFLRFTQKFKMATKNCGKTKFEENYQWLWRIPLG